MTTRGRGSFSGEFRGVVGALVLALGCSVGAATGGDGIAKEGKWLWHIGDQDRGNAELALAPNGYGQFRDDGFFLVGRSDALVDWPYAHPGPDDAWAGNRSHSFDVAFGLRSVPATGSCRLRLDLIDTQERSPPKLRVDVNGRAFERQTPPGAGDASILGEPAKGRAHVVEVDFPVTLLRTGSNHISITTVSGSWMLYDWVGLSAPDGAELGPAAGTIVRSVQSDPVLVERDGELLQTVRVEIVHLGSGTGADVTIRGLPAERVQHVSVAPGRQTVELAVPHVARATEVSVDVESGGRELTSRALTLEPVRKWEVYILPHSHVDIGYTHVQTDVEESHWKYYEQAIEASKRTASYPSDARFRWNVEVLWATDSYLRQASAEKQREFVEAVRAGWIGIDALYGNELTGLCRPEELVRLVDFAATLRREHGLTIESAMISDVPGYTWGIVPVLAQSGIKYFSVGPNGGHRIGYTLSQWGDRPFWWVSPCGQHRILCWIPRTGYWQGFRGAAGLRTMLRSMEEADYPYDLVQIRHCLGDNAGPGVDLSEFVKDWNAKYAYPRLVIATTADMMRDFEKRYGDRLPVVRGDFTPYWEDGAASSARETALNRDAAERLTQAETLYSMLRPGQYPVERFREAWRDVILYDEHTWGAHCSISQPESDFTKSQWAIKQRFALDADQRSRALLDDAVAATRVRDRPVEAVDVFNTCSWVRTDVVVLPAATTVGRDVVKDDSGTKVSSQRLKSGELAFLAADVPATGSRRYTVHHGKPPGAGTARADREGLRTRQLSLLLDMTSGAIRSLKMDGFPEDFVARGGDVAVNDYVYVAGRKPDAPRRVKRSRVSVGESGPLVASLVVESDAPGCASLRREVRVIDGIGRVDLVGTLDKKNVYEPEGVHIGFGFRVPNATVRVDTPWAVVRVEEDQIPGACKNYFTAQRWVDVSNDKLGVTLATIDAPLLEVGAITCDPTRVGWLERIEPSSTIYSYVMNNYWETNYRAAQAGPTTFRYSLRPHAAHDAVAAQRFGIERSQPLVVVPVTPRAPRHPSLLEVDAAGVVVTTVRPAGSGGGWIVRLFAASGQPETTRLRVAGREPAAIEKCTLAGDPVGTLDLPLRLAPWEILTCRVVAAD